MQVYLVMNDGGTTFGILMFFTTVLAVAYAYRIGVIFKGDLPLYPGKRPGTWRLLACSGLCLLCKGCFGAFLMRYVLRVVRRGVLQHTRASTALSDSN